MEQTIQLQFLDLDDIDHSEIEYVKSLLYSVRSPRLILPWVESEEVSQQWTHEQQYDGERELGEEVPLEAGVGGGVGVGVGTAGGGGGAEVYQVQVPVPPCTTMQQITYHHHQVVPPLPPPYGLPQPYTMPGYPMYPGEERGRRGAVRSKPSPKRGGTDRRQAEPPPPAYPPPVQYSQYPIHVTMPPAPYQYLPQAQHIPSAQHAAGPPLYLAPPPTTIPVYPTHIYGSYTPVFSPHMQPPQQQPPQQHQVAPAITEYKEPENDPVAPSPPVEKEDVPEEAEEVEEEEEEEVGEIENGEPPPPPQPPIIEKPPSMPINAIKTTAPPVLPVVKKRPPEEAPPAPAPLPPPPTPTPASVASGGSKSWAALFKEESTLGGGSRRPPSSALILSTPPLCDPGVKSAAAPPPPTTAASSEEDPALRRLGEMLSTYQLKHKAIAVTPRGLNNPSNYCYINATLQALLACPAFYNLIRVIAQIKQEAGPVSGPPPGAPPKSKTPLIDSMVQFIKEFSPAPVNRSGRREKALWKDKEELDIPVGAPFEPTYVYKMLHAMRNETAFQVEGRQEDAEEFLSLLLNGLNDEMLELIKMVEEPKEGSMVNGDVTANGESHQDDSDWKEVSKGVKAGRITRRAELAKTPLSEIFRGQLRSRLQRRNDEESTDSVQPFFTLQLDIESSDSVEKALEKFVGMYPVEGSSSGETWQQQQVEELPAVLILHLKCFHYRQQTCLKILKSLEFPIHLRFESKHVSNKNKAGLKLRQYKLFAVVYHDGKEASKGHYLADVFHVGFGGWLRFDDALVRPVSEATLLRPRPPRVPYLLYYRRADTIGTLGPVPR